VLLLLTLCSLLGLAQAAPALLPGPWAELADEGVLSGVDEAAYGQMGPDFQGLKRLEGEAWGLLLRPGPDGYELDVGPMAWHSPGYTEMWPVRRFSTKGEELVVEVQDPDHWGRWHCERKRLSAREAGLRLRYLGEGRAELRACGETRVIVLGESPPERWRRWEQDQLPLLLKATEAPALSGGPQGYTLDGRPLSGCRVVLASCDLRQPLVACELPGGSLVRGPGTKGLVHQLDGRPLAQRLSWCDGVGARGWKP
jgi:hypothetical protein